jgi:cytochrome c553
MSDEYLKKLGNGDGRVSLQEFAHFSSVIDSHGNSGKEYFGAGSSEALAEHTTNTLQKLSDLQAKTATVTHIMEQIEARLSERL